MYQVPKQNVYKNETYEIQLYQSVLAKLHCDNKQPSKILVSYNSRGFSLSLYFQHESAVALFHESLSQGPDW